MADFKTAATVGARIAAVRRSRGFKSTRDLAEAVPNGSITESILQNIEAGRKTDLTVSQLLNIAWALRVSPAFLLAPVGDPDAVLDLPNLSADLSALKTGEFDAWVAGLTDGSYLPRNVDERNEILQLDSMRELLRERRELERIKTMRALKFEIASNPDESFAQESTMGRIRAIEDRIASLESYLQRAGWVTARNAPPHEITSV